MHARHEEEYINTGKLARRLCIKPESTRRGLCVKGVLGDIESTAAMFRSLWIQHAPVLTCLEAVSATPKQGLSVTFKLGNNLGAWQGILSVLGARYRLVRPPTWQSKSFDPGTGKDPKQRSLKTARGLFPDAELHLQKHHGRRDALLLASYARGHILQQDMDQL